MKTKRNLSGVYFRHKNPETNKWENWVFEDLPEEKQREILSSREREWVESLCIILSNTLNMIGEQFDILAGNEDNI